MSEEDQIQDWLQEHAIEDVEAFVPDMAGAARGKVLPANKLGSGELKLPEGIFAQTVSGHYANNKNNVEDRDMLLRPDPETLRPVPWANDPTASIFLHCTHRDGSPVETSPRYVLRRALELFEGSDAMRRALGEQFVNLYTEVKKTECHEFQQIVTPGNAKC